MKRIVTILVSVVLLFNCGQTTATAQPQKKVSDERLYLNSMFENIKGQKLFEYVKYLSDSTIFQGRLSGTEGMQRAVDWVKGKYTEFDLEQLPGLNGYLQDYPTVCDEVVGKCFVEIDGKKVEWAKEWYAGGTSANGVAEAEVVFAGYGVSAPEFGYDDYEGIDVKGKIVLIEGETPNRDRSDEGLKKWYPYTLHPYKMANAVAHGAIGMLYRWVPGPNSVYQPGLVYGFVTNTAANRFFEGTGTTIQETLKKIRADQKPHSFATGKKARIRMTMKHNADASAHNIIGFVKGSDPELCNEYVILAAHLDHLGMIPHHIAGANDNNSATACLLGVAEALGKSKVKPKRSVIFLSLDGEEAGLTGSLWLCDNPVVPKESIKMILNLEQVGIGLGYSVGYSKDNPELAEFIKDAVNKYVHRPLDVYPNRYVTRPRTDGAVFAQHGYPVLDMFGSYGKTYYHEPRDTWEIQDASALEDAAKTMYWTLINAANADNL